LLHDSKFIIIIIINSGRTVHVRRREEVTENVQGKYPLENTPLKYPLENTPLRIHAQIGG
jgi:hypothetical protein